MRNTWTRISLIRLLAIALSLVLSFWIFFGDRSFVSLPISGRKSLNFASVPAKIADEQLCLVNLQQQKYTPALANCQSTVEKNADNLEAHLNLGLAHYHLENYRSPIAEYRLVIQQHPHDYRAFDNWGLVASARGEYRQAIEQYHTALSLVAAENTAERALIFNDLGAAWVMLKNDRQAIANLDRAIELDPQNQSSYFNRGCAYHRQGNYQKGIADFTRVITLDANYTEAYISRAILYNLVRHEKAAYDDLVALQHYQDRGDMASYQRIASLKQSMVASQVQQAA